MISNSIEMYRLGDPVEFTRARVNLPIVRGTWHLAAHLVPTTAGFSTMGGVSTKRTPRPLGDST